MPWARIDDRANTHAKLMALSDGAFRLWVCGLIYCQANLTDGHIPKYAVQYFGCRARGYQTIIAQELCASLVKGKEPLWHQLEDGWQVHDYLDWNESREKVIAGRQQGQERLDRYRQRMNAVRNGGDHPPDHPLRNAFQTPNERRSTTTSTTTSRKDREDTRRSDLPPEFAKFWAAYPRKVAKAAAMAEWKRQSLETTAGPVIAALQRQKATPKWREDMAESDMPHIPHARTWLHQQRWEDEAIVPVRVNGGQGDHHPLAVKVDADVRRLCDAAGLTTSQILEWFRGVIGRKESATGQVVLIIPDADARAWITRHYSEALEGAVISRGGSKLVITAPEEPV